MYFFASKILGFFLVPSNLILSLAILGLLLWPTRFSNIGKRIVVISILVLLGFGILPLGTALLLPLENRFPQWTPSNASPTGIIVLGGVISPELSIQRHEISLDDSAERLVAAVELSRQYSNARIVLVGGNSNLLLPGRSESEFAARLLKELGVPQERIEIENGSRNTRENALNALQLIKPKPGERWLLITSAYHMPRAMGLFRKAGFQVEAYPVDYQTGGWADLATVPSSFLGGLPNLNRALHEWAGLMFDRVSGRTAILLPGP